MSNNFDTSTGRPSRSPDKKKRKDEHAGQGIPHGVICGYKSGGRYDGDHLKARMSKGTFKSAPRHGVQDRCLQVCILKEIDHSCDADTKEQYTKEVIFKLFVFKNPSYFSFQCKISKDKIGPRNKHKSDDDVLHHRHVVPMCDARIFGRKATGTHGCHCMIDGVKPGHSCDF